MTRFPPGQRWWRQPPKGAFPSPAGRLACFPFARKGSCMVLSKLAPLLFKGRPPRPLPPERQRTHPLAPRADRPDGCHTPLCGQRPQAPSGMQPPRRLVFTAICLTCSMYRDPSPALRMTAGVGALQPPDTRNQRGTSALLPAGLSGCPCHPWCR